MLKLNQLPECIYYWPDGGIDTCIQHTLYTPYGGGPQPPYVGSTTSYVGSTTPYLVSLPVPTFGP